jgi:hypothetical protein
MKANIAGTECRTYSQLLLALVMASLISCSDQEKKSSSVAKSDPKDAQKIVANAEKFASKAKKSTSAQSGPAAEQTPAITMARPHSVPSKPNKVDEFDVVLGADKEIKIPGLPGELRVWIGSSRFKPNFPSRMAQDKTTLPAEGESATVEPFAPAFKVEPEKTQCIKIHPTGSEVRFKLFPQQSGTFEVGADVLLFNSLDCSGSPIPKPAATLKVTVEVDQKEFVLDKAKELWNIFWKKLLEFWAALVVLIFGLILFLIRRKLMNWFGYNSD